MTTTAFGCGGARDPAGLDDSEDVDPRVRELLDGTRARREQAPYRPRSAAEVTTALAALAAEAGVDGTVRDVRRMAGGASKEQFSFTLDRRGSSERLVLRLDPAESIVETCRYREDEVFRAVGGRVPTPVTRLLDGDGRVLGRPGIVTTFVDGVTKPPVSASVVSGVGTTFTAEWRAVLAPQFVAGLARIHATDWRGADLGHVGIPSAHERQPALWAVNWWARVWRDGMVDPYPLVTLAECWMRENLPSTADGDLVLLHGDYRTGNFMFDAETGEITGVLDWELAHVGDFHEDLGWILQRLFAGPAEDGRVLACSLLPREDLITQYEAATGRVVDRRTLAFYEVLAAYKCVVMNLGTGTGIAGRGNNHQDVLLSFLAPVGHIFLSEIAGMIGEEG